MDHIHQWRVTAYTLLTLPDVHGFADRFTSWGCVCGLQDALSGCIRVGEPLHTPAWWVAQMGVQVVSRPALDSGGLRKEVPNATHPRP